MRSIAKWTRVALIALSSCALGAGELAKADAPAGGAIPPGWVWQGVWQDGRWNGQWVPGPGMTPGMPTPGMPTQGGQILGGFPPPPGMAPWGNDPEAARMVERCQHYHHDGGGEGAVIGGVVGGVVGNRLAPGNRVAGTIGGAAVGAVAGAEIERHGKHARDRECEVFFRDHPDFASGYPAGVPPYGPQPYGPTPYGPIAYAPVGYIMVPVITGQQQPCVETRTVTTTTYIVDKRRRTVWTRPAPHHKDKRVYTGS